MNSIEPNISKSSRWEPSSTTAAKAPFDAAAASDAASSSDVGRKTAAILSLDGGGSKGVMELVVLDAMYRMLTVIVKTPHKMPRYTFLICLVKQGFSTYDSTVELKQSACQRD